MLMCQNNMNIVPRKRSNQEVNAIKLFSMYPVIFCSLRKDNVSQAKNIPYMHRVGLPTACDTISKYSSCTIKHILHQKTDMCIYFIQRKLL